MNFTIKLVGTAPLLMHSARLADPLDPVVKAIKRITGKSKKTEEDLLEVARLEFAGGLYMDSNIGPYIPSGNIWRCLQDAAKIDRGGEKVKRGLVITSGINPLNYDGPRTEEELWANENFRHRSSIKVMKNRVVRVRPVFPTPWSVEADGIIDPSIIDFDALTNMATNAGTMIGLGDWRPIFGRFEATVTKI